MVEPDDSEETLEKVKMGFLDHLDELRRRLIHSVIALVLLFGVSWFFSDRIYDFLQRPVNRALHEAFMRDIELQSKHGNGVTLKEGEEYDYIFQVPSQVLGTPIPAGTTIRATYEKDASGKAVLVTARACIIGNVELPAKTPLPSGDNPAGGGSFGPEEKLVIDTVAGGFNL